MNTATATQNIAVHVCIDVNITTLVWEIPVFEYHRAFPLFSKKFMYLFVLCCDFACLEVKAASTRAPT